MKKTLGLSILIILLCSSMTYGIDAFGSAFGALTTANTLGQGEGRLGGGIGIADGTSFFGSFTYGMAQYFDGRIKLGILDYDGGDAEITFGAEAKYQIWSVNDISPKPFDLSLGGLFEYVSFGGADVFQIGGMGVASYPTMLSNGKRLIPYGRMNIRIEHVNISHLGSDSKLKFGLNGGVAYEITDNINIYGEFQLDGNDGLFLGLDYRAL